jgi:hypothetical protein
LRLCLQPQCIVSIGCAFRRKIKAALFSSPNHSGAGVQNFNKYRDKDAFLEGITKISIFDKNHND